MENVKKWLPMAGVVVAIFLSYLTPAVAADWRQEYEEVNMGVITEENAEDLAKRWDPAAFKALMGGSQGFRAVTLEDYQPVIRFVKANLENRKQ